MGIVGGNGGIAAPERLVRYRWAAELSAGRLVLDAACGAGSGTRMLAARAAAAVGVDFSPAAIADARQEHDTHADFREGDLRDLPFGDGEFDDVVCFEAIAHVAEPAQVLDELRRVLRPRGRLLISAPNRDAYPAGNPLHLNEMTPEELESLLHARFSHVAVRRQQIHFASLLCSDAMLAHADPTVQIDLHTVKAGGGQPGSELHALLVATDGEPPPPPAWLAIGEEVDYGAQRKSLEAWQDRAVRAEAKALALERELRALQS